MREAAGDSLTQAVADHLHDRRLLLVLDNCEHLAGRMGQLTQCWLRAAPQVRILITSQRALGIPGEVVWRVPSLAVPAAPARAINPGSAEPTPAAALGQCESVRLFVARGQAILPTFALTESNARPISQICWRLDGIPLAIELAAAHVRTLTPQQIALRLDNALDLLGHPTIAQSARHRTLQATIGWSHELLSQRERILFRRLAVFAGSFTLAAVEAICPGHGIAAEAILELLAGLEDKSMLESEATPTEVRFRLHEVIRQYALARLTDAGESERTGARHLDYYGRLVAEAELQLTGSAQGAWLDRLEAEHDNLRAALGCSQGADDCREAGLRMVGGLARFWATRGYFGEGRHWARSLLAAPMEDAATPGRLAGLTAAAYLAYYQGDYAEARGLYDRALAAAQALGDKRAIATITRGLGTVAHAQGDCAVALRSYELSLAACRDRRPLGRGHRASQPGAGRLAARRPRDSARPPGSLPRPAPRAGGRDRHRLRAQRPGRRGVVRGQAGRGAKPERREPGYAAAAGRHMGPRLFVGQPGADGTRTTRLDAGAHVFRRKLAAVSRIGQPARRGR